MQLERPTPRLALVGAALLVALGPLVGCSEADAPPITAVRFDRLARILHADAEPWPKGRSVNPSNGCCYLDMLGVDKRYHYPCGSSSPCILTITAGLFATREDARDVGARADRGCPDLVTKGLERMPYYRTGSTCAKIMDNAFFAVKQDPETMAEATCEAMAAAIESGAVIRRSPRFPDKPAIRVRQKVAIGTGYCVDFHLQAPQDRYFLPRVETGTGVPDGWYRLPMSPLPGYHDLRLWVASRDGLVFSWTIDELPGKLEELPDLHALGLRDERDELRRDGLLPTEQEKWAIVDKALKEPVPEDQPWGPLPELRDSCRYRPCPEFAGLFESLVFGASTDVMRSHALAGLAESGNTEAALALARACATAHGPLRDDVPRALAAVLPRRPHHPLWQASTGILDRYGTIEDRALANRTRWRGDPDRFCADGGLSDPELVAKWKQQAKRRAWAQARKAKKLRELGL